MHTFDQRLVRVVEALCSTVGSEVSQTVLSHVKSGNISALVSMRVDPSSYTSSYDFLRDNACVELFRKTAFETDSKLRREKAVSLFWESERQCARTNTRIHRLTDGLLDQADLPVLDFVENARKWIRRVLGPLPRSLDLKFGPGATYNNRGRHATLPDKIESKPTLTAPCVDLLKFWEDSAWARSLSERGRYGYEVVRGNRFTTVPKDAVKDRGICIEPSLNVGFQLSIGSYMKRRLLLAGLDLFNGQDTHRTLARESSRDGRFATIDLSSASDTVAYRLVRLLLPDEWFEVLDALRSPFTWIDGRWVRLEKFSSMGNGFTFELETLIFSAICFACGAGEPSDGFFVYGDDIIVVSRTATAVLAALRFFGFAENSRKTFLDGPFRESCGGDFFNGVPVRAHYLKELPHEPQHWIALANGLRRLGRNDPGCLFGQSFTFHAWLRCLDNLPSAIRRLRGPEELGDLVVHDDRFSRRWRSGIGYVRVYRPVTKLIPWDHWSDSVKLASLLYSGRGSGGVTPRGSVSGYKLGWSAFS